MARHGGNEQTVNDAPAPTPDIKGHWGYAISAAFAFEPRQHVRVVAFGLGYPGRVTQCVLRPLGRMIYEVEYAADGDLHVREFDGDELEAA
jgi:hypothetical protein